METLWVGVGIALAACVQSVTGFGFPLVAIAVLPLIIDLSVAVPLVLIMSLLNSLLVLWQYRQSFRWRAVMPLVLAALVMIPVGLVGVNYLSEAIARKVLGLFVLTYALYDGVCLFRPQLGSLSLKSPKWVYVFGGLSGFLTGAFTTGGPPLVMYANAKGWKPNVFKSNLSSVYVVSLIFALCVQGVKGTVTAEVGKLALYSLPLFALGVGFGFVVSRWIDPKQFKKVVLVLLGMIGLRLIF